ncbi:MAG: hypothetical protein KatS3mg102_0541 [Planctomycetota bacterium]|nr:MAG: hypothetical protein KatS3mg102_0541 [Planctomycetota bacterium]
MAPVEAGGVVVGLLRIPAEGQPGAEEVWAQAARWVAPPRAGGLGLAGLLVFGGQAPGLRARLAALERCAGRRLLLCADLERGAGQQVQGLTRLPHALALGAAGDPALARRAGALTAREARAVGLCCVLGPCADLALHPDNPIIDVRAFGDEPERVGTLVRAWIEGAQDEGGVLACAKHFPGHGDVVVDSHVALPLLASGAQTLARRELVPFRAAVRARVAAVMTAHLAAPALTGDARTPVTLSARAVGWLRARLGHQGLVITDALLMGGVLQGLDPAEAAVQALAAGCDVLLAPADPEAAVRAIARACACGRLAPARVREARGRIAAALARLAPLPAQPGTEEGASEGAAAEGGQLARTIAERALVAVRGERPPVCGQGREAVVVTLAGDAGELFAVLAAQLAAGSGAVRLLPVHAASPAERCAAVRAAVAQAELAGVPVAIVVGSAVRAYKEQVGLPPRERELLAALIAAAPRAAVVALGSPRLLAGAEGGCGFRGFACSDEPPSQAAVARALLGGLRFGAASPLQGRAWRARLERWRGSGVAAG